MLMSLRSDVSPSTLSIELAEEGVYVTYLDGREVLYRGVPEAVTDSVRCQPGKQVHVLVTNEAETQGAMIYLNDRKTHDEILESTGVGRVVLEPGDETELMPGVQARADGYAIEIDADAATVSGRIFVFEEDDLGERAYEIVAE